MTTIRQLYDTLKQRRRPEDIAGMVMELTEETLTAKERLVLKKAAKGSLVENLFGYTSMLQAFANAVGAEKQVAKAIEIFNLQDIEKVDYNDADNIENFITTASAIIKKPVGQSNFKTDRLNKTQRKDIGLDLSKRNYNKKWRIIKRLEKKLLTFVRESRKIEFQMIAKHGLAHQLDFENFSKDLDTACFIAYYNSRCNLRSEFTIQGQQRAFDEISEILLNRCKNTANWWAIAYIYTSQKVLSFLTDEQKGTLLGRWTTILQDIALLLNEVWSNSDIDKQSMIVKRGNDSSTWNNSAGAWNKARDNWINLVYNLGMDYILDELCFGKVLRLMAADIVAWHKSVGGKLDPNTEVWNALPLPWEVFEGKATCNKEMVSKLCIQAGIDAEKSGWIAPRVHGVVEFRPTPELVHGVVISNPFLATVLKKHKYFSGKNVNLLFPENN
jgi:hypothetical protein